MARESPRRALRASYKFVFKVHAISWAMFLCAIWRTYQNQLLGVLNEMLQGGHFVANLVDLLGGLEEGRVVALHMSL